MKIALLSDIHANLPALEAVLADIDERNPDQIYCLGDLVSYAPQPNEVVELIRQRKIPTIAGNHDEFIGLSPHGPKLHPIEEGVSNGTISKAYTNQILSFESRTFLKQLPRHFKLDFQFNEEAFSFLMVHGSPRKINEYIFEDHEEEDLLSMMQNEKASILAFGHTHKPFHRILKDEKENYHHAINLGSVGKPKDDDNRACYVMLEITDQTSMKRPDGLKVEFIRVPYDIEKVATQIENSPLPDVYADMLRKGY
ncbi:MAG: metallophosphoesterase family protein [Bacteroidota bacterium]